MTKDFYRILGVKESASVDEIRERWIAFVHDLHPDRAKELSKDDQDRLKEINEAYDVLKHSSSRVEYDLKKVYTKRKKRYSNRRLVPLVVLIVLVAMGALILYRSLGRAPLSTDKIAASKSAVASEPGRQGKDRADVPGGHHSVVSDRVAEPRQFPSIGAPANAAAGVSAPREETATSKPGSVRRPDPPKKPASRSSDRVSRHGQKGGWIRSSREVGPVRPDRGIAAQRAGAAQSEVRNTSLRELAPKESGSSKAPESILESTNLTEPSQIKLSALQSVKVMERSEVQQGGTEPVAEWSRPTIQEEVPLGLPNITEAARSQPPLPAPSRAQLGPGAAAPEDPYNKKLIVSYPYGRLPVLATRTSEEKTEKGVMAKEADIRDFFIAYRGTYRKKDTGAFLNLFSAGAVQNGRQTIADIRRTYEAFFNESQDLQFQLRELIMEIYQNAAEVRANYRVDQFLKNGGTKIWKGPIRWVLVRENGNLKVLSLDYEYIK
jgi:hypothetical protein